MFYTLSCAFLLTIPLNGVADRHLQPEPTQETDSGDRPKTAAVDQKLVLAWTIEGDWLDVVSEPQTGGVFALRDVRWSPDTRTWTADVSEMSMAGNIAKTLKISGQEDPAQKLAVLRLKDGQIAFVTYGLRRETMYVHRPDGAPWWSRQVRSVNAVPTGDIDQDGDDDILVCTLGGGVLALRPDGTLHWNALVKTDVGDAMFIPPNGLSPGAVVATLSATKLAFVTVDGKAMREVRPDRGPGRLELRNAQAGGWQIVSVEATEINVLAADGSLIQSTRDTDARIKGHRLADTAMSLDRQWLGVLLRDGLLLIYDASSGKQVASVATNIPRYSRIAWSTHPTTGHPCIIMASASGLFAYELQPGDRPSPRELP